MKHSLIVALPIAVSGILLAATPFWLFPVCAVQPGAPPMRCHWSGVALVCFGVAFFIAAALLFLWRNAGARAGISAMAIVMAMTAWAIFAHFIGVCASPMMPCRTGTYPAAAILLALVVAAGAFNIVHMGRFEREARR